MYEKKLVFRVKRGGAVSIEGMGFQGEECLTASKLFTDRLGEITEQVKKPEYDEVPFAEVVEKETW